MSAATGLKRLKKVPAVRWLGRNAIHAFDTVAIRSKSCRLDETIVVAGSPRTGTTLVMEILGWLPRHATLFEPLHPGWFRGARAAGFGKKAYLPENADEPGAERYMREVLTGKAVGRVYYFNVSRKHLAHRLHARRLVVKFVRGNQLLPWLASTFPVRAVVLVLRHPCAVVASQLKSGFTGYILGDEGDYMPDAHELGREVKRLIHDFPDLPSVADLTSPEEILAAIWCLDTIVPLRSGLAGSWYVMPYERLLEDQQAEIDRLFAWLGEPVPDEARKQLRRPTQVVRDESIGAVVESRSQLPKWTRSLSEDQITRILSVVARFGIDFYGADPAPDRAALERYVSEARTV